MTMHRSSLRGRDEEVCNRIADAGGARLWGVLDFVSNIPGARTDHNRSRDARRAQDLEPCPLCNTSGPKFRRHVRGEAVAVDLGSRGTLFALMVGGTNARPAPDPVTPEIVEKVFGPKQDKNWRGAEAVRALGRATGKADVPAEIIPFMVRFRDLNDPKSVERVDPDNLAASFGPGVKLVKATIEITSDPVTTGIEKTLRWLRPLIDQGGALDGTQAVRNNELMSNLGGGAFKW
jgi:hypothetical protein